MDLADRLHDVETLLATGRFQDAAAACKEILALEPENPRAFIALGQAARGLGDRVAASGHFRAAAERLPQDIWRKLDVAEELMASGQFTEAVTVCEEVLALAPDNPQAFIILGQCARGRGEHIAALGYFQSVADHLPQDIWRKLDVVAELMTLDRFEQAAALCRDILAIEPDNPQVLITLGQCVRRGGNRMASLEHFQAAAERLPQDIWRKLDVVEELMALGRFEQAEAVCGEVQAIAPGNPQALIALGQCARRRGDRASSLGHFQAAAVQLPRDVWRKLDVAEDLLTMERYDETAAVCRDILLVEPDNPQALILMARGARRDGEQGVALAYLQAAATRLPEDMFLRLTIVGELLALGRTDEADGLYRGILATKPAMEAKTSGLGRVTEDSRSDRLLFFHN
jgi:tetratricopeptide (TPR) repeat protein